MTGNDENVGALPERAGAPAIDTEVVEAELLDTEVARREPATGLEPPAPTEVLTPIAGPGDDDRPAAGPTAPAAAATAPRPTIRWGALVWALIFGAVAGLTLWVLSNLQHRDDALAWLESIPLGLLPLYGLLVVGVIVALFGGVGLIRRGERRRRAARG
ncbi:hypothetical protein PX701_10330 [Agromyces sp. H3Y2-19a]|uniref:hypothetical protein n=1 Tax=Agromyces chromiiresistens TaxID=3030835 RepID=UPI0023B9BEA4|nr:hypothetical protein [Agromyces chromiiresistens]MDF0514016.1 hypothetical protein [Agromyces chromiiresistens]